jgi:endonuclease/exonuclease/phosphatase family metal-dependent hydrolase
MEAIGRRLARFDLDVMAFQEVWTADAREILLRGGRAAGLANAWYDSAAFGGGGLLVLSRLPVAGVHFERFTLRGQPERITQGEYYGGKGFARIALSTDAGPIALINTHLHARYASDVPHEYRALRAAQVVELALRVRETGTPVIAAGDFNFQEGEAGYGVLTGLTGFRDAAAEIDRRQPTVFRGNAYRSRSRKPGRRIDFLFVRDGRRRGITTHRVDRIFDEVLDFDGRRASYSDHAGVMAEFEIAPRAAAAPPPPDRRAVELASRLLSEGREEASRRQRGGRVVASASIGCAAAALGGVRVKPMTRRKLLRRALRSAGLVAVTPGVGFSILSEFFVSDELAGFDAVSRRLARLDGGPPGEAVA